MPPAIPLASLMCLSYAAATSVYVQSVHTDAAVAGVVEEGRIYFLYRPRVNVDHPTSIDDIQRFFIILAPASRPQVLASPTQGMHPYHLSTKFGASYAMSGVGAAALHSCSTRKHVTCYCTYTPTTDFGCLRYGRLHLPRAQPFEVVGWLMTVQHVVCRPHSGC